MFCKKFSHGIVFQFHDATLAKHYVYKCLTFAPVPKQQFIEGLSRRLSRRLSRDAVTWRRDAVTLWRDAVTPWRRDVTPWRDALFILVNPCNRMWNRMWSWMWNLMWDPIWNLIVHPCESFWDVCSYPFVNPLRILCGPSLPFPPPQPPYHPQGGLIGNTGGGPTLRYNHLRYMESKSTK